MTNPPLALTYQPFAAFTGSEILQREYDALAEELEKYLDTQDMEQVLRCAVYGAAAHEGQKRKSGEPYFVHPINVCKILAKQEFVLPVLQAALLHDVLEDNKSISKTDIARAFSSEVACLVDGVSKLDKLKYEGPLLLQAASFKKMFTATADDPRVLIIKLADRLHNMQTLGSFRPEKQKRIAKETLDVYAVIAGRLGLFYFRIQLEDLAFSYLYPWRYQVLRKHYLALLSDNEVLEQVRQDLMPLLAEIQISASVNKRQRHFWGLYQRMKRKQAGQTRIQRKQTFYEASRTVAIRIITDTKDNCYRILGKIHELYRPIQGKFEDYIAAPKSNGYRSLHTSVLMANGNVLNIQIRTRDMHTLAETGIISVWHQDAKKRALALQSGGLEAKKCMRLLSSLKEVQNIIHDPLEFYRAIKKELVAASNDIYVYTPAGEVIDLPNGATAVDFAYAVRTELGNHCYAAMVNGQPYPICKPLAVGQTVRIITDTTGSPHAGWLQFVVTEKAKAGINYYIHHISANEARTLGYRLLDGALKCLGDYHFSPDAALWSEYLDKHAAGLSSDEVLAEIGRGTRQPGLVASLMLGQQVNVTEYEHNRILQVGSALDSGIAMGECCYPLPYEKIIGQMTPDVGITIHRQNCSYINCITDREYRVRVAWSKQTKGMFCTLIEIRALERSGLLADVAKVIADVKANIADFHTGHLPENEQIRVLKLWLEVRDTQHLAQIIQLLHLINNITEIFRI